jgi:hypothetical protein
MIRVANNKMESTTVLSVPNVALTLDRIIYTSYLNHFTGKIKTKKKDSSRI